MSDTILYTRGEFIDFVQKCRDKKPFIVFRDMRSRWSYSSAPSRRPFVSLSLSFWDHCLRKHFKWSYVRIWRSDTRQSTCNLNDGFYGHIEKCPMHDATQELTLFHDREDGNWFTALHDFVWDVITDRAEAQRTNLGTPNRNDIIYMKEFKKILSDFDKRFFLENSSIDEL